MLVPIILIVIIYFLGDKVIDLYKESQLKSNEKYQEYKSWLEIGGSLASAQLAVKSVQQGHEEFFADSRSEIEYSEEPETEEE